MRQHYIKTNPWSIIEEGFDPERVMSSESLCSIGNGAIGQRANFEEKYSGDTFQGSYIGGIYYPDKTRVGWWKNGYPEYFAKVLNSPAWIGIHVNYNDQDVDLADCTSISDFRRELNMREGWLSRSFIIELHDSSKLEIRSTRFLSMKHTEVGVIKYSIKVLHNNGAGNIHIHSFIDGHILNHDSNWDDQFWEHMDQSTTANRGYITSKTLKTNFHVATGMINYAVVNGAEQKSWDTTSEHGKVHSNFQSTVTADDELVVYKFGCYCTSLHHDKPNIGSAADSLLSSLQVEDYNLLLEKQIEAWADIWAMADIKIEGDDKAQQGIRFNIFQLNQTYTGADARLNVGPKGFTGEKYGGSTYWDTEAYCIPFYMSTKQQEVARNLLVYRYNQLDKAIENAKKLGFTGGAALYPMVTMNGEECHNEWEITFEEIHRNGAMVYAIYNYIRYTGDYQYMVDMGYEVVAAIARFWVQRFNHSEDKQQYVMLGVTGPNEYENNINNNWYTNYIAQWCIRQAIEHADVLEANHPVRFESLYTKIGLSKEEIENWKTIADNIYLPYDEARQIYLQQDGYLDKELIPADQLPKDQRPINQVWSWDRILRSCYIKQADTLQGFYFFDDHFSREELERHFNFYEPLTVHESSLSPCIHSILAARLGRMDQAYQFYLQTSRLDLDDYNKEVEEGLHITSMAGTWSSVVEGFGGMRIKDGTLSFTPQIPANWDSYSFKVNYRGSILQLTKSQSDAKVELVSGRPVNVLLDGKMIALNA